MVSHLFVCQGLQASQVVFTRAYSVGHDRPCFLRNAGCQVALECMYQTRHHVTTTLANTIVFLGGALVFP